MLVGLLPFRGAGTKRAVRGMRVDPRLVNAVRVVGRALPAVVAGSCCHARADWVEFDIPVAREDVALAVHQR